MALTKTQARTTTVHTDYSDAIVHGDCVFTDAAMELLTKQFTELYRDPIIAMVRETISNAIDATVKAGVSGEQASVTVDVSGTDADNGAWFTVTDHGVGMSMDDVLHHFVGYGDSTKRDDLTMIGSYGYGSKSPLAYADRMIVETVRDGERTVFELSRSAGAGNQYAVLEHEENTSTVNGTIVRVPIANDADAGSVLAAARKYQNPLSPVTVIVNGESLENTPMLRLASIPLDEENTATGDLFIPAHRVADFIGHILLDGVYGRENGSELVNNNLFGVLNGWKYPMNTGENESWRRYGELMFMELKPGAVDFSPSRDDIMNNTRLQALVKRVESSVLMFQREDYKLKLREPEFIALLKGMDESLRRQMLSNLYTRSTMEGNYMADEMVTVAYREFPDDFADWKMYEGSPMTELTFKQDYRYSGNRVNPYLSITAYSNATVIASNDVIARVKRHTNYGKSDLLCEANSFNPVPMNAMLRLMMNRNGVSGESTIMLVTKRSKDTELSKACSVASTLNNNTVKALKDDPRIVSYSRAITIINMIVDADSDPLNDSTFNTIVDEQNITVFTSAADMIAWVKENSIQRGETVMLVADLDASAATMRKLTATPRRKKANTQTKQERSLSTKYKTVTVPAHPSREDMERLIRLAGEGTDDWDTITAGQIPAGNDIIILFDDYNTLMSTMLTAFNMASDEKAAPVSLLVADYERNIENLWLGKLPESTRVNAIGSSNLYDWASLRRANTTKTRSNGNSVSKMLVEALGKSTENSLAGDRILQYLFATEPAALLVNHAINGTVMPKPVSDEALRTVNNKVSFGSRDAACTITEESDTTGTIVEENLNVATAVRVNMVDNVLMEFNHWWNRDKKIPWNAEEQAVMDITHTITGKARLRYSTTDKWLEAMDAIGVVQQIREYYPSIMEKSDAYRAANREQ